MIILVYVKSLAQFIYPYSPAKSNKSKQNGIKHRIMCQKQNFNKYASIVIDNVKYIGLWTWFINIDKSISSGTFSAYM